MVILTNQWKTNWPMLKQKLAICFEPLFIRRQIDHSYKSIQLQLPNLTDDQAIFFSSCQTIDMSFSLFSMFCSFIIMDASWRSVHIAFDGELRRKDRWQIVTNPLHSFRVNRKEIEYQIQCDVNGLQAIFRSKYRHTYPFGYVFVNKLNHKYPE